MISDPWTLWCCRVLSQPAGDERPPHRRRTLARFGLRSLLRVFLRCAVGANEAIPMRLRRKQQRWLPAARSSAVDFTSREQLSPSRSCKPEMAGFAGFAGCTSQLPPRSGYRLSRCLLTLLATRSSVKAAKVEPWADGRGQTALLDVSSTLRWTRAPAFGSTSSRPRA
jgi:hypothetical protein